jgi:hypothetical protein
MSDSEALIMGARKELAYFIQEKEEVAYFIQEKEEGAGMRHSKARRTIRIV